MKKTKIEENWQTIRDAEKAVQEQTGDPQAGFNASSFFIGGKHLGIPCMYRGKKGKKGQEEFTQSYKEVLVFANFCPFSGKPLYQESTHENQN